MRAFFLVILVENVWQCFLRNAASAVFHAYFCKRAGVRKRYFYKSLFGVFYGIVDEVVEYCGDAVAVYWHFVVVAVAAE